MKFEFILSNTKKLKQMLNANDRPHWTQKAKITAFLRATAAKAGQKYNFPPYSKKRPCGLVVTIYAPTKRRLDPPNFYPTVKALVDGLTDAGIWTDDNSEVIKYMTFKRGELSGIAGKYRIELEIKEYDEEVCCT